MTHPRHAAEPTAVARSWASTWGLVLIALLAATVVGQYLPQASALADRMFVREAAVGEQAELRTTAFTVDKVALSRAVTAANASWTTPGLFVVASVTYTPTTATMGLPNVQVQDTRGRVFGGRQLARSTCRTVQPGVTITCDVPLEVSEDAIPGLHLLVWAEPFGQSPLDDSAEIDLGLTAETPIAASLTMADARFGR